MTSGAKVVIAMFGAIAAITIFVVGAFLLTDTPSVRCVEGELQDNTVRADGSVLPRVETYSTLEEAEAFICRRIPHPRSTGDMTLRQVRVARERNLGDTIEGDGGADIEIDYAADAPDERALSFGVVFPGRALSNEPGEPFTVNGEQALLARNGDVATVRWYKAGFSYTAAATLDADFTQEDLLQVLESVR